ncbi:MAG: NADH-quinone oxidoreductase subunit NuoH [Pirellulales bacterium]
MSDQLWSIVVTLITIGVVFGAVMTICAYLVLLERKLSARMQDRIGPNRVGPWGLLQPLADGIKLVLKEDPTPAHVDTFLYRIAPMVSVFTTLLAFAVVPFGPVSQEPSFMRFIIAPHVDIGIVFIFAVTSLAVYGVILGGWASNNKYSMLGSLRASAQVVSYEIPLGMSVLGVALLTNSLNLERVLTEQAAGGFWKWNFWYQPLACLVFFTSALAESNRMPFDLPECEQELVGGYHTEYGGFRFAMYFLGEYVHVTTVSFLVAILFFGGWHFPWIATADSNYTGAQLVKIGVLLSKVGLMIVLIMLIRWTIPRFRFDQLMGLAWKVLIPISLANVVIVMTVLQFDWNKWWIGAASVALFIAAGVIGVNAKRAEIRRRPRATHHAAVAS